MKPNLKVDSLKDKFGNDIHIGDTVVYVKSGRCQPLDFGVVVGFAKHGADELFMIYNLSVAVGLKPKTVTTNDVKEIQEYLINSNYPSWATHNVGGAHVLKYTL